MLSQHRISGRILAQEKLCIVERTEHVPGHLSFLPVDNDEANVDRIPVTTQQDQELTTQNSGEMAHPQPQSMFRTEKRALHVAKGYYQDE